jgi:protein-tyrosine phosphatase
MMSIPPYSLNIIHSVHLRGINVILAHPERNREIASDVNRLRDFVRLGALVQVNSLSLLGVFGSTCRNVAEQIVRAGLAHIIATDCHTARSRAPRIKKALSLLDDRMGHVLTIENPTLIMEGKKIEVPEEGYKVKRLGIAKKLAMFFSGLKTREREV